jgi:hypothetical protein
MNVQDRTAESPWHDYCLRVARTFCGAQARLYQAGGRFALKPSAVAGIYVLLPLPSFLGGFVLAFWIISLLLFSSLETAPFIYFQF